MASLQPASRARTQHLQALNPPSTRSNTASPTRGSVTQTQTIQTDAPADPSGTIEAATLRLRGAHDPAESRRQRRRGPAIRWAEDVVDNEGMGRKSSKVCCIYHRPRAVGESSSEEDSSSSSSDDESSDGGAGDDGSARPVGGDGGRGSRTGKKRRRHQHHHHGHDHDHEKDKEGEGAAKEEGRRPSPNAYERMPKTGMGPKGK
ncbi:hypothetical protein GJ744_009519 [Endocarpon pusillum]|uniref:Type 1 phosphatases regulator n=1 Tax=Endocarpon pusillum TaxID=364733 RepID=A0A8H7AJR0_9EURO|nr:hypothetical protein GJ744_009519 [Endocarpon pusillum]